MKVNVIIIVLSLFYFYSTAQRFIITASPGYNTGIANQNLTYKNYYTAYQSTHQVVSGSFGQGSSFFTGINYKKDSLFTFELGFQLSKSPVFNGVNFQDTMYSYKVGTTAWMLRFMPAIKVYFYKNSWRSYLKLFPVFRLAGGINAVTTYEDLINNNTIRSEVKYSHGLSIGAGSALGTEKKLSRKLTFVAEINFIAQSWAPRYGDVISYSVNGQDQFSSLSTNQKHIHFERKYNSSSFSTYKYAPQLRQYFPFSSIGINLGLKFELNGKTKK